MPATHWNFAGIEPVGRTCVKTAPSPAACAPYRIGIVCNPRAHRNRGAEYAAGVPGVDSVLVAAPRTREALAETLRGFAERGIDLLVIDGGDGTVRDVLTAAGTIWRDWPAIAVIPSGKTNALAIDLGLPVGWSLADAVAGMAAGRTAVRRPLEIARDDTDASPTRGFLFGAGAFVKATALAQRTHRAGAFNNLAVGLALGWALALTMVGRGDWRRGDAMALGLPGEPADPAPLYIALATTLTRLPMDIKVFGRVRDGLKLLAVSAPARRMPIAVPALLAGSEAAWLDRLGYRRHDVAAFHIAPDDGFILDGEHYAGGRLTVRQGPMLSFVVP